VVGADGIEGWGDIFAFGPLPASVRENPLGTPHLGIVGLAIGATISDWIEYRLLARALAWRVGRTHLAGRWIGPIAVGCAAAAAVAWLTELLFGGLPSLVAAVLIVGPAALAYVAVTFRQEVPEAAATVARVRGLAERARR